MVFNWSEATKVGGVLLTPWEGEEKIPWDVFCPFIVPMAGESEFVQE